MYLIKIFDILGIDKERYDMPTLLALGYPAQAAISEDYTDSIKYYLDDAKVLHVPKRTDVLL